jgi:hypothetical protein
MNCVSKRKGKYEVMIQKESLATISADLAIQEETFH